MAHVGSSAPAVSPRCFVASSWLPSQRLEFTSLSPHERTPLLATVSPRKWELTTPKKHEAPRRRSDGALWSSRHMGASFPSTPTSTSMLNLSVCSGSWDAPSPVLLGCESPASVGRREAFKSNTTATTTAPKPPLLQRLVALAWKSLGYLCIAGTVASWVLQNEAMQCLQTGKCIRGSSGFNRPYTITWWTHSCLSLLLPLNFLIRRIQQSPQDSSLACTSFELEQIQLHSWHMLLLGLPLAAIYLVADYFWYLALPNTPVFVATAIMNANCAFVYLLSVALCNERVSYLKLQALSIAIGGILVIAFMAPKVDLRNLLRHKDIHETLFGDVHAAGAAFFFALYEVCFAKNICTCLRVSSINAISIISGYIGLSTLLLLWPGILIVHLIPEEYTLYHEQLHWPGTEELLAMAVGGTLTLIFNVMMLTSVALTSPLKTNVGCMMTIPICGLVDYAFRGAKLALADVFGGVLVIGGFVLLMLHE
eukprot:GGOE01036747.1.p1 GENE.GGOE01036747.1~~GGOE01036747.1.p1  ORF type:complete len:481 (+),score=132.18 GGOE01036747.1:44-1486(+)